MLLRAWGWVAKHSAGPLTDLAVTYGVEYVSPVQTVHGSLTSREGGRVGRRVAPEPRSVISDGTESGGVWPLRPECDEGREGRVESAGGAGTGGLWPQEGLLVSRGHRFRGFLIREGPRFPYPDHGGRLGVGRDLTVPGANAPGAGSQPRPSQEPLLRSARGLARGQSGPREAPGCGLQAAPCPRWEGPSPSPPHPDSNLKVRSGARPAQDPWLAQPRGHTQPGPGYRRSVLGGRPGRRPFAGAAAAHPAPTCFRSWSRPRLQHSHPGH